MSHCAIYLITEDDTLPGSSSLLLATLERDQTHLLPFSLLFTDDNNQWMDDGAVRPASGTTITRGESLETTKKLDYALDNNNILLLWVYE